VSHTKSDIPVARQHGRQIPQLRLPQFEKLYVFNDYRAAAELRHLDRICTGCLPTSSPSPSPKSKSKVSLHGLFLPTIYFITTAKLFLLFPDLISSFFHVTFRGSSRRHHSP
jgi:hypothetical protein